MCAKSDMLEPGQQLLLNSLQKLVSNGNDFQVSLPAAMILVNTGNVSDTCIAILKYTLHEGTPTQKVEVSYVAKCSGVIIILPIFITQALECLMNNPCCTDADIVASAFILLLDMRYWRVSKTLSHAYIST